MARYSFPDVIVSLGGSSVPDVTVVGDFAVNPILEEVTPVGSAPQTHAYTGVYGADRLTLESPYSTTSGDLQQVIMAAGKGATIAVILTWGGTKTSSFSSIIAKITRGASRGAFTKFSCELQPTGAVSEA